jgi:hypothetical protein
VAGGSEDGKTWDCAVGLRTVAVDKPATDVT